MKFSSLPQWTAALVLLCAGGVAASLATPQDPSQPTDQHAWLLSHVGTWDAQITGAMGDSTGTWEVKPGPGGRWVVGELETEMMGMSFQGLELLGFDPATETFTSIWVDSMLNTHQVMTGKYDAETKTLTTKGESEGMGGEKVPTTQISRYPDADHATFEMIMPGPDGEDMTVMKVSYTRRK